MLFFFFRIFNIWNHVALRSLMPVLNVFNPFSPSGNDFVDVIIWCKVFNSSLTTQTEEKRTLTLSGHVGFDSLPDQLVSKSVSQGFCFNILCVGELQRKYTLQTHFNRGLVKWVQILRSLKSLEIPYQIHLIYSASTHDGAFKARSPLLCLSLYPLKECKSPLLSSFITFSYTNILSFFFLCP